MCRPSLVYGTACAFDVQAGLCGRCFYALANANALIGFPGSERVLVIRGSEGPFEKSWTDPSRRHQAVCSGAGAGAILARGRQTGERTWMTRQRSVLSIDLNSDGALQKIY